MGTKTQNPQISVVIPTLNEESYISRCLTSLKKQTFKDFEIIISDGGSSDNTLEIAKRYGARVVVHLKTTVTLARQSGINASKGKLIVGADADTVYPPDHLKKIAENFKTDDALVAVGGGGEFEKKPFWLYVGWKITYRFFAMCAKRFNATIYIPAFNLSFKKKIFDQIGGYRTYLDFGGDELDILDRLKKIGKVDFDSKLICYPSSRRAKDGLFSIIFMHTLRDYYLGFLLAKIFKRTIIYGKPVR